MVGDEGAGGMKQHGGGGMKKGGGLGGDEVGWGEIQRKIGFWDMLHKRRSMERILVN